MEMINFNNGSRKQANVHQSKHERRLVLYKIPFYDGIHAPKKLPFFSINKYHASLFTQWM